MNRIFFQFHLASRSAVPLCCGAVLVLFASSNTVRASEESMPDSQAATAVASASEEGRQMLIVMITLAGALIGMERGCSWRLGVLQLSAILPPIFSDSLPLPARPTSVRASSRANLR